MPPTFVQAAHTRIEVPGSCLFPRLFADFYRVGPPRRERPLICFWGGATTARQYESSRRRRAGAAGALLRPLTGASFDFLFVPNPPVTARPRPQLRCDLHHAFAKELLPRTANPRPSSLGFLGYSAGACVALCLALDRTETRAVATLGGAGMAEALEDAPEAVLNGISFASFLNDADPLAPETFELQWLLRARGADLDVRLGAGGHEIEDYGANGLAAEALAWLVRRLDRPGRRRSDEPPAVLSL